LTLRLFSALADAPGTETEAMVMGAPGANR
jgi:hypothetical protein